MSLFPEVGCTLGSAGELWKLSPKILIGQALGFLSIWLCYWYQVCKFLCQNKPQRGVWSRERLTAGPCKENGWLGLENPWTPRKGFSKAFLKARLVCVLGVSQGMWPAHEQFSDWLMVRNRAVRLTLSILRHQKVWGLHAHDPLVQ